MKANEFVLWTLTMLLLGCFLGILVAKIYLEPSPQPEPLFKEQKIDRFLQGKPVSYTPSREQLMHFTATCRVMLASVPTPPIEVHPCRLDDLSAPGYWNRWAISLDMSLPRFPRTATWVREEITVQGGLLHNAILYGTIDVLPDDTEIRDYLRGVYTSGGRLGETRPQNVTVLAEHGRSVVLIDEPKDETDGLYHPSQEWERRWFAALAGGNL